MMKVDNKRRIRKGVMASTDADGNNGCFEYNRVKYKLRVVCSDGMNWEHVSVSRSDRKMPTWLDMCYIKERFWPEEDTVMQLHPPKSEWISNHDKCLHLWRPSGVTPASQIPLPPSIMVGIKGIDSQDIERLSKDQRIALKQAADSEFNID